MRRRDYEEAGPDIDGPDEALEREAWLREQPRQTVTVPEGYEPAPGDPF